MRDDTMNISERSAYVVEVNYLYALGDVNVYPRLCDGFTVGIKKRDDRLTREHQF